MDQGPRTKDQGPRTITVGHSPDPDDAFMFYALAHDKIDTGGLKFRHELQDIETLNRRALAGELEVTAVSIHAYAHLLDKYALLPSGCSMGDRYGPMVVARRPLRVDDLKNVRTAVPGTYRVHGELRYQACNDRACFPPKTLPVAFDVKVTRTSLRDPNAPPRPKNPAQSPHIHQ